MADDAAAPESELSASTTVDTSGAAAGATESPQIDIDASSASVESEISEASEGSAGLEPAAPVGPSGSSVKLVTVVGLVAVLVTAGLAGGFGFRYYQNHRADQERALFLQIGRQGAINLTTIDYQHADADVQRILDSATDRFYDDFSKRSQPFVEVVKQAQSRSTGEVTAAGIESIDADGAQVLVAVTVKTSNAGAQEQQPRAWRMRVAVKKTGKDEAKVSNVEFVP